MSSLLIRDIDEETKRSLAIRAAENGRSQQAEALSILESALGGQQDSWFSLLHQGAQSVGGIELPQIERHQPRITGVQI